jgi:neutral ceramidase
MAHVEELIANLRGLGIPPPILLVVEVSNTEIPESNGGLEKLASALQAFVGPVGTLVVPTCTPSEGYPRPVFDPAGTPSEIGPFSEFFRGQADVVRSHNPTHSVAAWGGMANDLVAGHRQARGRATPWGESPFGRGSPWDLLYEHRAWWLIVDVDWEQTPFTAYIKALYVEQHQGITKRTPFPQFDAEALGQALKERGILFQAAWGRATITLFNVRAAVDTALQLLGNGPSQFNPDGEFRKWLETVSVLKASGYLQAGVAKAVITPPLPGLRWDGKKLLGVSRDLYARVLVLSQGGSRVALVLCDLLGITAELVNKVREGIKASLGFTAEAVLIACTHAHSTPDTVGSGYEDPEYLDRLVDTIVEAVCTAEANSQSARMGWGRAPIRGFAESRRKKMHDGSVFTTRYSVPSTWRVAPDLIASEGTIDPDLTVIRIEDLQGSVLAVISNFGCHASVALMSPDVSGDFPGEAMAALECALGEPAVVLCTNGAGADVDPTREMPYWGPRNDEMARRLGRLFAAQVLECLERIEVEDIAVVGTVREQVNLDVRVDWIELLETESERMQQELAAGWSITPVIAQTLRERVIHTEMQGIRLNGLILIGFPGEVFTDTSLALKSECQDSHIAVVELANDDIGYIPTEEIFAEGGYEVGHHLWGRVSPKSHEAVLAAARRLIRQLQADSEG